MCKMYITMFSNNNLSLSQWSQLVFLRLYKALWLWFSVVRIKVDLLINWRRGDISFISFACPFHQVCFKTISYRNQQFVTSQRALIPLWGPSYRRYSSRTLLWESHLLVRLLHCTTLSTLHVIDFCNFLGWSFENKLVFSNFWS